MNTPKLIRFGFILPCLVLVSRLAAQETNFTQFFNLPTALNPAYISVPASVELTIGYRKRWPNLQGGLQGAFAGAAIHQCGTSLGYGLTVAQLGEDVFGYRIREATFQLGNYVNTSKHSSLHMGLQATIGTRGIDANNQVFSGQLDPVFGIIRDNSSFVSVEQATARTFALGGGVAWRGELAMGSLDAPISAGVAVHNLGGSRDISFENIETTLRPRFIAHFSMALPIADKFQDVAAIYVTPIMRLDLQGKLRETYAGCIFQFQKTYIGLIYQNARNPFSLKNTNTLSIGPGIELDLSDDTRLSLGYNFDMPLSGLGPRSTNGSHELSVRFKFDNTCVFGSAPGNRRKKGGVFGNGGRRGKTKCYEFNRKNFLGFLN